MDVTHAMLKNGSTYNIIQEDTHAANSKQQTARGRRPPQRPDPAIQTGHAIYVYSYNSEHVVPLQIAAIKQKHIDS